MDISVAIPTSYLLAAGTPYTGSPGDTIWKTMLAYFNLAQQVWAAEPGGDWESLYNPGISAGAITATNIFALPTGILKVSNKAHDKIYVTESQSGVAWVSGSNYTAGQQVIYENVLYQAINNLTNDTVVPSSAPTSWNVIPPQISTFKTVPGPQLRYYSGRKGYVAISGGQLVFSRAFLSTDLEYGGTLYVPAFESVTTLSGITGAIQVDSPAWLMYYAAQEWAQVDVTLVQNVPSLIAKASDLMTAMKLNNQRMKTLSPQMPMHGAAYGDTFGLGY